MSRPPAARPKPVSAGAATAGGEEIRWPQTLTGRANERKGVPWPTSGS